ncbi:MAG: hypothetical protein MHPSP_002860, partial [Paramarteilia canceri]
LRVDKDLMEQIEENILKKRKQEMNEAILDLEITKHKATRHKNSTMKSNIQSTRQKPSTKDATKTNISNDKKDENELIDTNRTSHNEDYILNKIEENKKKYEYSKSLQEQMYKKKLNLLSEKTIDRNRNRSTINYQDDEYEKVLKQAIDSINN